MKDFVVYTKDAKEIKFKFPNSIDEISEDYLTKITEPIHIADNYTLVGLCYNDVLSRVILMSRTGNKSAKIKVTPIFIKAGETDIEFIKTAKIKQKVITNPSQLSLGTHVTAPYHKLSLDYFVAAVTNSADKNIYDNELAKGDDRECIFIEFKIIPNSDIIGFLDINTPKVINPYVNINSLDGSDKK